MAIGVPERSIDDNDNIYYDCIPEQRILQTSLSSIVRFILDLVKPRDDGLSEREIYEKTCSNLGIRFRENQPHFKEVNMISGTKEDMLRAMVQVLPYPCRRFYHLIDAAVDAAHRQLDQYWLTPNDHHFEDDGFKLFGIYRGSNSLKLVSCYMYVHGHKIEQALLPLYVTGMAGQLSYEHRQFILTKEQIEEIAREIGTNGH